MFKRSRKNEADLLSSFFGKFPGRIIQFSYTQLYKYANTTHISRSNIHVLSVSSRVRNEIEWEKKNVLYKYVYAFSRT